MHRILLFKGEPYAIYSYGFMLVVAMMLGVVMMVRRGPRVGLTRDQMLDLALAVLLGGMIGGRAFSVIYDHDLYANEPVWQWFNIRSGGLAWHGGLLGGLAGFWIYQRRSGIDAGRLIDAGMPAVVLGHIAGRFGCFLNGCCYGRETTVPWAVTYPDAPECLGLQRHPTQIYEMIAELAILLFMTLFWEKRQRASGSLLYVYLVLYGAARFVIEFYREDPLLLGTGLDLSQFISIAMVALGIVGLLRGSRGVAANKDVEVSPTRA